MHMPLASPGKPQDSRARNLATQERKRQKALQRLGKLRREAMAEIERLITFLDETDGYTMTEAEPSLGFPELGVSVGYYHGPWPTWTAEGNQTAERGFGTTDDREDDDEREPDDPDEEDGTHAEPSLAAPENHPNAGRIGHGRDDSGSQLRWFAGNRDEREGDGCDDDREADELLHGGEAVREDDEPFLGWTDEEAASGRFYAGSFGRPGLEAH